MLGQHTASVYGQHPSPLPLYAAAQTEPTLHTWAWSAAWLDRDNSRIRANIKVELSRGLLRLDVELLTVSALTRAVAPWALGRLGFCMGKHCVLGRFPGAWGGGDGRRNGELFLGLGRIVARRTARAGCLSAKHCCCWWWCCWWCCCWCYSRALVTLTTT